MILKNIAGDHMHIASNAYRIHIHMRPCLHLCLLCLANIYIHITHAYIRDAMVTQISIIDPTPSTDAIVGSTAVVQLISDVAVEHKGQAEPSLCVLSWS